MEGVLYRRYNIGLAAVDVKAVKNIVAALDDNSTLAFSVSVCNQREIISFFIISLFLYTQARFMGRSHLSIYIFKT